MRLHQFKAATLAALLAGALGACSQVSGLETQARILSQPSCSDFFFPIYFPRGSAAIPPATRQVIAASGRRSKGCRIDSVEVVGLPPPDGEASARLQLALERAQRVVEALQAAGFPVPRFQLSPLGEAGDRLPEGRALRRRADVYVRFAR